MKNIFAKNKFMKKLLCVIMFSVIIASSFTVFASAAAFGTTATHEAPIEWTLSEDGEKLTASTGTVYYRYEMDIDAELNPWNVYYFANSVKLGSGNNYSGTASVRSYARDGEIVWITSAMGTDVYVTEVGEQMLKGFADGTERIYNIARESNLYYSKIDATFAEELREAYIRGEQIYTFDVRELRYVERYYVQFGDSRDVFWCDEGYIFDIEGEYYYVHFDSLDNTHFDADGYFSFRSGEVELMKLDEEMSEVVGASILRLRSRETITNFETDDNNSEMPMIFFWMPYVFIGFILPLPFLALGLIFANVRKKSKYWYAVVISAGVWMLLAAILMVILIL